MNETKHFSCAETAKFVRLSVQRAFPKVKFSVRSKTYSGGASITVHWTDGPCTARVEKISKRFEGADFDGMIDLKSYVKSTVSNPDGTFEDVHYGADFVFSRRENGDFDNRHKLAEALIRARCVCEGDKCGNDYVPNLASRIIWAQDCELETMEQAFERVVIKRNDWSNDALEGKAVSA